MENHVCLSCGVLVTGATWRATMMIMVGVGDLVQRIRNGQAQVGYSVAERSGGRVTPCAVCTVHVEIWNTSFFVEPQNQGHRFSGLSLKIGRFGLVIWVSKSSCQFLGLCLKTKMAMAFQLHHKTDGRMIRHEARVEIWRLALPGSKSC
jgi:hypothetical protein